MDTITANAALPRVRTRINIAIRLTEMARRIPHNDAVVMPLGKGNGKYVYRSITFAELEADSNRIAAGLIGYGLRPGNRIVLMVRPSIDFIALTFALFKAGAVTVLIDPGMGRESLVDCLSDVQADGFVAVPLAHALRVFHGRKFRQARLNVTVGRRWFWGGPTLRQLRTTVAESFQPTATAADDPAAIIFTTGSTGPPKGVLYRHGNFDTQVTEIQSRYGIEPGGVDLAGFPLFGLFNCAMGMTTVIPDMDASRPATVDPQAIVTHVKDRKVTQSFASPAVWNVVGRYCEENDIVMSSLRLVLSAGAPVPVDVLARMKRAIADDGEMFTPYGATESLPIASISASEVLRETADMTADGAGTCVGRKFDGVQWKVIEPVDGPIHDIGDVQMVPNGEIGELIVSGGMVTSEYVTRTECNAEAKIRDGSQIWHRMGDLGYLDGQGRFWFCGRKTHRVLTAEGPMCTVTCEAIYNQLPEIYRSALVGIGQSGCQTPVIICEPHKSNWPQTAADQVALAAKIAACGKQHWLTCGIQHVLLHPSLPVDIRHNAKIFREKLSVWAALQLGAKSGQV